MSRDIAFELVQRVENDDAYANLLLPTLLKRANVDSRDAGFVQEIAFGVIRNKLLYEQIIERASGRKISEIDSATRIVILIGTHQLLSMRVSNYAAINETVNLAKSKCKIGAVGFVNAVLRKISSQSLEHWTGIITKGLDAQEALAVSRSHPIWIVNSLKTALSSRNLSETLPELLDSHQTPARVSLVALPGLSDVSELRQANSSKNPSPIGAEIDGNPALVKQVVSGQARVQDQGSQLVTLALAAVEIEIEDKNWLDMCAGPGGKAALLAAIAQQRGISLQCNEVLEHRAKLVAESVSKFKDVKVSSKDGRDFGRDNIRYSRILLDAPCTGLGALRRRPEARWRKNPSDLSALMDLQKQLLEAAWLSLLPGGLLAYVTCSPHLSETTAQIAWFENKFKHQFEFVNSNHLLNGINSDLQLDESFQTTKLWPHIHNTDAMFLALISKSLD